MNEESEKSRLNQSVIVGFKILRMIAESEGQMTLAELSKATNLYKSQIYRYLNSFQHLGVLVRENNENPSWAFGPELITLGEAALNSFDLAKHAKPSLLELKNEINETVALSIWKKQGPYFLCWEKSNKTINIGLDTGSYVPIFTATGIVFRAFLPEEITNELYQKELQDGKINSIDYDSQINQVRMTGVSYTKSSFIPGIVALSSPIFSGSGQCTGALSVIGLSEYINVELDKTPSVELRNKAIKISKLLGYTGEYPPTNH